MTQPITHEQIRANISPFFFNDFVQVEKGYIQPGEKTLWVANHASLWGFGYFMVTTEGIVYVHFSADEGILKSRTRIYYRRSVLDRGPWLFDLPSYPLSRNELKSRQVTTARHDQISNIKRTDWPLNLLGKQTVLVILAIKLTSGSYIGVDELYSVSDSDERSIIFYNLQDGQTAHSLIQAGLRRDAQTQVASDIADQLKKLADLHKSHAVTEQEYEAAKRKLLGL